MRPPLSSLILVMAVVCAGCGKHTHELQVYTRDLDAPDSSFEKKVGPFLIYLIMQGTRRVTNDGGLFDTARVTEPPYTLHIGTLYYGQTVDTAEIRKVTMQVGDQIPIVLLGEHEPAVSLAFKPALDHAMSAGAKFALDDALPFIDGKRVTVDVEFVPPESTQTHSIRTVFRGRTKVREISVLELVLQGS